jgi:hypothetical protein
MPLIAIRGSKHRNTKERKGRVGKREESAGIINVHYFIDFIGLDVLVVVCGLLLN